MKKITLVFTFMLAVAGAAAQSMYVHKTDGNVYEFKVSDVDSINFAASTTDDYLYTVTYMPNGGTGTMVVDTVRYGCSYTFKENAFGYASHVFVSWNTSADGKGATYAPAESVVVIRNITLYAQWDCVENGYEWVDLGLSVKWATCNVGATTPEGYGNYYAWGETTPKTTYNWSTYKWCNGSSATMTKYCTSNSFGTVDNKTVLDKEDDAASVNMGGSWRMPTKAEQDELRTECSWTWTTLNGVNGYNVEGPNGNSIFLPAAGYRYNSGLSRAGSYGHYWSSSLNTNDSGYAYGLNFYSVYVNWDDCGRYYGRSVRGVFSH